MLKSIFLLTMGLTMLSFAFLLTGYFGNNTKAIKSCRIFAIGNLAATIILNAVVGGPLWNVLWRILEVAIASFGLLAMFVAFMLIVSWYIKPKDEDSKKTR